MLRRSLAFSALLSLSAVSTFASTSQGAPQTKPAPAPASVANGSSTVGTTPKPVKPQPTAPATPAAAPVVLTNKMYVLTIDTDDVDAQAEALSQALRSRVRTVAGADGLGETQNTLGMMTMALRCPPNPDTACLNKIGDTLKTNRFIWGRMNRADASHVAAHLHLFVRGKSDVAVDETYSDNLKDGSDDTLRKLASKLYDRLTGTYSTGMVKVHAGDGAGQVFVDGERRGKLDKGIVELELPVGHHAFEVRVPGYDPVHAEVDVKGESEALVEPILPEQGSSQAGPSTRKIAGYAVLGLGVVSEVVSALFASKYAGDHSDATNDRRLYAGTADCGDHGGPASAACTDRSNATRDSALAWTFGGVGVAAIAAGAVMILTDSKTEEGPKPSSADSERKLRLVPSFGPKSSGMTVVGTF